MKSRVVLAIATGISLLTAAGAGAESEPFQRTEERERCRNYDPLRQPFFGDTHVHTRYSFDSYVSSQRNDPWGAYRYAKGEAITLPGADGEQDVIAQIQRPLDFTAVTDHAEYLGEINVCTQDSSKLGYWWPLCIMTRSDYLWTQLLAASWWVSLGVTGNRGERSYACELSDCAKAASETWSMIQRAADDHYDRSAECGFTTFVAYEYTDAPDHKNLHRNVIFRNEHVTKNPISTYDTGSLNFPDLWVKLRDQCIDAGTGCDVLAIPHNPNLSGGLAFRDPLTRQEAEDRLFFEPLVELIQHKAGSECRYDRSAGRGLDTEDELCNFEQAVSDNLSMLGTVDGEVRTERAAPVPLGEFGRRNMVRNALKDGLMLGQTTGINPFRMGFVAATDTHSATAGGAEEDNYVGHLGRRDSQYRNVQDHFYDNPGGHGVVWAEENSRDSLFEGMRRKETYATSGTRPTVRFFAGWDYPDDLCADPDLVAKAYAGGVPMGGDLPAHEGSGAPRFIVSALKDGGSVGHPGTDLQRIQLIKGWASADGATHERVYDVAGDADNGANVDPDTCAPTGRGFGSLCSVWSDPEFDASQPSFYYLRVLENPTCRWSTLQCQAAGVNPFSSRCEAQAESANAAYQEQGANGNVWGNCCIAPQDQPFYEATIQERAWTSPIWFTPQ